MFQSQNMSERNYYVANLHVTSMFISWLCSKIFLGLLCIFFSHEYHYQSKFLMNKLLKYKLTRLKLTLGSADLQYNWTIWVTNNFSLIKEKSNNQIHFKWLISPIVSCCTISAFWIDIHSECELELKALKGIKNA